MSNLATINLDSEKVALLSRTIAKGCSPDELALFTAICKRTGLDPFARQIHAVKRWDGTLGREVMQPQVSIDGARLVAQRSGEYQGQDGPWWCGDDGVWTDVWLKNVAPKAAKVQVFRRGFSMPISAVASFNEYAQRKKDGSLTAMWAKMPALMIAKCAEALALRKAFPAELSGVYVDDELHQGESEPAPISNVVSRLAQLPSGVLATGEQAAALRDAGMELEHPEAIAPPKGVKCLTKADATGIAKALEAKAIPMPDLIAAMERAKLIASDDMSAWPKEWLPRIQSWIKQQKSRVAEPELTPPPEKAVEEEII